MITVLIGSVLLSSVASASQIDVYNNCAFTIWPGIIGPENRPASGGFKLDSGENHTVDVPEQWFGGIIWARTGCDSTFNCETGTCNNQLECSTDGVPPVSLAMLFLGMYYDAYAVVLLEGFNVPVSIEPKAGTFIVDGGERNCKRAGACVKDPNQNCPQDMTVKGKNGQTVGCKSACLAFDTDQYCCRGAYNNPNTCKPENWPSPNYYKMFKDACPAAYVTRYDDEMFLCRGKNDTSADYVVQFC